MGERERKNPTELVHRKDIVKEEICPSVCINFMLDSNSMNVQKSCTDIGIS